MQLFCCARAELHVACQRHGIGPRLRQRFAHIKRFEPRQFIDICQNQLPQLGEETPAFSGCGASPVAG